MNNDNCMSRLRNNDEYKDFTDGAAYKKCIQLLPAHDIMNTLTATFNKTWEHMLMSFTTVNPIFEVKKTSSLTLLSSFNIVTGFIPDSMHCICLGIGEQFLGYWMQTCNN
ncbi:hypothetical protein TSAR_010913, partial [Trichomalopsis sarcophagae]